MPRVAWNPGNGVGAHLVASRVMVPRRIVLGVCGCSGPCPLPYEPANSQNAGSSDEAGYSTTASPHIWEWVDRAERQARPRATSPVNRRRGRPE
jgi:hypothetical protein